MELLLWIIAFVVGEGLLIWVLDKLLTDPFHPPRDKPARKQFRKASNDNVKGAA